MVALVRFGMCMVGALVLAATADFAAAQSGAPSAAPTASPTSFDNTGEAECSLLCFNLLETEGDAAAGLGIYVDTACDDTGVPGQPAIGCNAYLEPTCRFCVYDREAWIASRPNPPPDPVDQYVDCPVCVGDYV